MEQANLKLDMIIAHQFRLSKIQDVETSISELGYDVERLIIKYIKDKITIILTYEREEAIETDIFLVKPHILKLSLILHQKWEDAKDYLHPIKILAAETQAKPDTFKLIMKYLEHHDGKEPTPIPSPVRSTDMHQIVEDEWDADFIDSYNKQQVFEIILGAYALECTSLVHLGCAKVATLVKSLDQREIDRIIQEEENQLEAPDTSHTPQIQLNLDENHNDENSNNENNQQENDER